MITFTTMAIQYSVTLEYQIWISIATKGYIKYKHTLDTGEVIHLTEIKAN